MTKDLFDRHLQRVPQLRRISPAASTSSLYGSVESLAADRDRWELILTKLKSRRDAARSMRRSQPSDEQIDALVKFLETEFARADASMKPDPGRVTARRLNRAEYTNTIRDLLAIDFRADKNFPTDDSARASTTSATS